MAAYGRAAIAQRSLNLQGFPLVPKWLLPNSPHHREAFNQFILWIHRLQLPQVHSTVDVGANHGDFSLAVSAVYPNVRALLVEPLPALHAELEARCARQDGRWRLIPCAIGSVSGNATLHIDPQLDAIGSLAGFSEDYLKFNKDARPGATVQCMVRTLDEVCAEQSVGSVDFLKIDVEGFELEVLRGAKQTLPKTRAVVIEVSLARRRDSRNTLLTTLEILLDYGFHIVELYPSAGLSESPWKPVEFNLLVRRM
jgi:FkbM family methyltransferase